MIDVQPFIDNTYYKSKCIIFSPFGIIPKGVVMSSEEWKRVLVYEVGNSFNKMFRKLKKPHETLTTT